MKGTAGLFALTMTLMCAGLPLYAADTEKAKPQQSTPQKSQKTDQKQKRSDTGPQGEEQTGGAGPSGPSSGGNVKAPQHEGAGSKPTH
jgi:hypothetical protein